MTCEITYVKQYMICDMIHGDRCEIVHEMWYDTWWQMWNSTWNVIWYMVTDAACVLCFFLISQCRHKEATHWNCLDEAIIVSYHNIAPDKRGIYILFFLFRHENICCGYSLEVPQNGTSNEYPQHMFSCRNKKKHQFFSNEISIFSN